MLQKSVNVTEVRDGLFDIRRLSCVGLLSGSQSDDGYHYAADRPNGEVAQSHCNRQVLSVYPMPESADLLERSVTLLYVGIAQPRSRQEKTEKATVPVPRLVTVDVSNSVSNSVQLNQHERVSAVISTCPSVSYVSGDLHAPVQALFDLYQRHSEDQGAQNDS
jgi:hypothetical protein